MVGEPEPSLKQLASVMKVYRLLLCTLGFNQLSFVCSCLISYEFVIHAKATFRFLIKPVRLAGSLVLLIAENKESFVEFYIHVLQHFH